LGLLRLVTRRYPACAARRWALVWNAYGVQKNKNACLTLPSLRQFAEAEVFVVDWGAFGFDAEVAGFGVAVVAAGDFFAVDPEADFAVDGADVVVVPFARGFAEILAWEAAAAIRRDGLEGRKGGGADFED